MFPTRQWGEVGLLQRLSASLAANYSKSRGFKNHEFLLSCPVAVCQESRVAWLMVLAWAVGVAAVKMLAGGKVIWELDRAWRIHSDDSLSSLLASCCWSLKGSHSLSGCLGIFLTWQQASSRESGLKTKEETPKFEVA